MYRVHLQQFEGPLDLLLFFIRRDELDIYDIPIAQIADEFLAYVRLLEEIDLDGVGDFLYMAALLIGIKARMLLPSPEVDEEGEPLDPRRELVERLLEYIRFKEAAQALAGRHEVRAELFTRGRAAEVRDGERPDPSEALLENSVYDLVSALRRILTRPSEEPVHQVRREEYTIEEQSAFVLAQVFSGQRVSFVRLVAGRTRAFIIATFLAVLELARQGHLSLYVAATDDFYLERSGPVPAVNGAPDGDHETG
ncbi:MAG: segregation and condensation protein A [Rhodothermaceae bacterium]|nr:MAG: segregation and condensation protein A [Rhodothermaceae bacterium]